MAFAHYGQLQQPGGFWHFAIIGQPSLKTPPTDIPLKLLLPNLSSPLCKHFRQARTVLQVPSNTVTIPVLTKSHSFLGSYWWIGATHWYCPPSLKNALTLASFRLLKGLIYTNIGMYEDFASISSSIFNHIFI